MEGLPANTNPFCVNHDVSIEDGLIVTEFPEYFDVWEKDDVFYAAKPNVQTKPLSQEEAEALVRRISETIAIPGEVAVKEAYKHIIPADLRAVVPVTKSLDGRSDYGECYYLE